MKHIKIDETTFNRINDYYLEIVCKITDYKIDNGLKLRTYNLFEIVYNQLHYRNRNNDFIPIEELKPLAGKQLLDAYKQPQWIKLAPEEYNEIIFLDPKKASNKKDCRGNVRGTKKLNDGTILHRADYIDKAISEFISDFKIVEVEMRDGKSVLKENSMFTGWMRQLDSPIIYLAFNKYSSEKLLELSNHYGRQFVLDKLKLDSVYAKNLYSYICRNYGMIREGKYYNPTTKKYTNGEYIGEEVNEVIKALAMDKFGKNNAIKEIKKAVDKINEILDFGLNVEFPKGGIGGKTSEIERIKFTLNDNKERDLRYMGKYKPTHNTNRANIHNRNKYNNANKPKLDYQVMAESEDYVEGRGEDSGLEF